MTDNHSELTLFEQLEKIRKEKKISLEDISKDTRIPVKHLESMEKGDILSIPRVYDKLFFKTYLKVLGLPEKDYYEQFLECRNQLRQEKTTTINELITSPDSRETPFNYKNLFVILPVLSAVIVILFLLLNTKDVETPTETTVQEINIQNIAQQIEEKNKNKIDTLVNTVEAPGKIALHIKALKKTWMRVIIDKRDTIEYMLDKDKELQLLADKFFEFLIGRADGIMVEMNNRKLTSLGKTGEVVQYMLIDSSGIIKKRNVIPKIK